MYSYVTLVTNEDYALAARALARSLIMTGAAWPLTVLAVRDVPGLAELGIARMPHRRRGTAARLQTSFAPATAGRRNMPRPPSRRATSRPSTIRSTTSPSSVSGNSTSTTRSSSWTRTCVIIQNIDRLFGYPEFVAAPNVYESLQRFPPHEQRRLRREAQPAHLRSHACPPGPAGRILATHRPDLPASLLPALARSALHLQHAPIRVVQSAGLWDWNSIHVIHYQYEKPWEPNHPKREQLAATDRPVVAHPRTGRDCRRTCPCRRAPMSTSDNAARRAASSSSISTASSSTRNASTSKVGTPPSTRCSASGSTATTADRRPHARRALRRVDCSGLISSECARRRHESAALLARKTELLLRDWRHDSASRFPVSQNSCAEPSPSAGTQRSLPAVGACASAQDPGDGAIACRIRAGAVRSDDIVDPVTDRKIHSRAAEMLGADPADCIVIEDSAAGVSDACDSGIGWVIGLTTSVEPADLYEAGADDVVDSLHGVSLPPPVRQ